MNTKPQIATGAGLAGVLYLEEGLVWLIDKLFDLSLLYKDSILLFIANI